MEGSSSTILTGDMGSTGVGGAIELGETVLPLARAGVEKVVEMEGDSVPVPDSHPDGGNVSSPSSADGEGGGVGTDLHVQ